MHLIKKVISVLILSICTCSSSFAIENVFYILRSNSPAQITEMKNSIASLKTHAKSIDILISQAYQIDKNGLMWGFVDRDVMDLAKQHSIKLMAMITNASFDKEKTHAFLSDTAAQKRALDSILDACKKNHYYGIQLDFEMIALEDKEALTHFYKAAADLLHKNKYAVSFAVAPVVEDSIMSSDFQKRIYENWEGAYDLSELGKLADFLTVMVYNQHGDGTTPGPTASIGWTEAAIKNVLQYASPEKISLGMPAYSAYWYTARSTESKKITQHLAGISYDEVDYILKKNNAKLHWDETNKFNFAIFEHNWLNEYLYVEDAQSFKAKMNLVKKYNLSGISVFYIGIEDPKIWALI